MNDNSVLFNSTIDQQFIFLLFYCFSLCYHTLAQIYFNALNMYLKHLKNNK